MKKLNIQNILVPIDFSKMSIQAIDSAKYLARRSGANVHLVHVYQFEYPAGFVRPAVPPLTPLSYSDDEAQRLRHKLYEIAHDNDLPTNFCHLQVSASPFHETCHLARDINADVIVMPTHGRGGLKRFLLGSTAERVVQHAPCPVLIARHRGVSRGIDKILVPVDFSECSFNGLQYAIQLAEKFTAKILVLHSVYLGYAYTADGFAMYDLSALEEDARKNAEIQMHSFVRRAAFGGVKFETAVQIGTPIDDICAIAEKGKIDLIVTSTHGRTGFAHIMMGSTAEQIVRHASTPVLVVPSHPDVRAKQLTKKPAKVRNLTPRVAMRPAVSESKRLTKRYRKKGSHSFPERRRINKFRESHLGTLAR